MELKNIIIIGGVVALGGIYLYDKSKKDKSLGDAQGLSDAQALALANAQSQNPSNQTINSQAILTPKEATVYATKTIAEVNSLIVKYPPLFMSQFIDNYNRVYRTNLTVGGDAILGYGFYTPKFAQTTSTGSGFVKTVQNLSNAILQENIKKESEIMASKANRQFKAKQMIYTLWKSDFATVYSDLKNYFSTLSKERADIIIKYLPKLIIQSFMGDDDPRARANDFYSQEEIIDMIDNSGIKDPEQLLKSALNGFFSNYKNSIGEYSGLKTAIVTTISN